MRISTANRADGRFAVTVTPESPGEPSSTVRDFLIDATIVGLPGDRLLAVAALAFGAHLRGSLSTERPVSPLMTRAIARFQEPILVVPTDVSPHASQFTGGGATLVLDPQHRGYVGRNDVGRGQVLTLDVLPTTTWTGRLFSMDRMVVASNASFLASQLPGTVPVGPQLAVAVALAHELHVSRIVLPTDQQPDEQWFTRTTSLLAAAGIDLQLTTPSALADLDLVNEPVR